MKIGVISADIASESRVALTPDAVKKLRSLGLRSSSSQVQGRQPTILMRCIRRQEPTLPAAAPR